MKIVLKPYWLREDGFAATITGAILGGLAVVGAAVSAYGAYSSGQAQKSAANFNAQVAQNNATAARQQAAADAAQISIRNRRLAGSQVAEQGAAGVSGGSADDVIYDSAVQGELNRLTTLYKGNVKAGADDSQSQLDRAQASYAGTAGEISAGGSILSGLGQGYYDYNVASRNQQPTF